MITRIWHGRTPAAKAEEYTDYIRRTGLDGFEKVDGVRRAWTLRRVDGDVAHFLVVSQWESWDAIRGFAGQKMDRAVYYPDDDRYLLEREPNVVHYETVGSVER